MHKSGTFCEWNMRTNIDIDDALVGEVMRVANVKTKKEAVHLALQEFLKVKKKKISSTSPGKSRSRINTITRP